MSCFQRDWDGRVNIDRVGVPRLWVREKTVWANGEKNSSQREITDTNRWILFIKERTKKKRYWESKNVRTTCENGWCIWIARACVCVSISNCNNYISVHIWLEKVTRYVPSFSFFVFFFCFFLRRRFLHELTSQNVSMMLSKQKKNFICPFSSLVLGDCFLLRSP